MFGVFESSSNPGIKGNELPIRAEEEEEEAEEEAEEARRCPLLITADMSGPATSALKAKEVLAFSRGLWLRRLVSGEAVAR